MVMMYLGVLRPSWSNHDTYRHLSPGREDPNAHLDWKENFLEYWSACTAASIYKPIARINALWFVFVLTCDIYYQMQIAFCSGNKHASEDDRFDNGIRVSYYQIYLQRKKHCSLEHCMEMDYRRQNICVLSMQSLRAGQEIYSMTTNILVIAWKNS